MRALQITSPGKVEVIERPVPKLVGDEFLLRVNFVGMCGTDLSSYLGKNPLVSYPRVLGHEVSATILEAPGSTPAFAPGTNVTVSPYLGCGRCPACLRNRANACQFNQTLGVQRDGAMTELIGTGSEKLYAAPGLTPMELALVEPLTIGFHAARRGRIEAEDVVAVFGCGGVGVGAIFAAAERGATVIAVDIDDKKLQLARACGATHVIHSKNEPLHERLMEMTNGRGPDVMVEAIGLPATFRAAVEEAAFTGRVVYIGYAKDLVPYETRLFVQKELDILGSRNAVPQDFHRVIAALQKTPLPVEQIVSTVVPMEEAGNALSEWSAHPSRFQKILVQISNAD